MRDEATRPPRPEHHASAEVVRVTDRLHRDMRRIATMPGAPDADRVAVIQGLLILDRIRDRHRAALGYAERPRPICVPRNNRR